MTRALVTQMLNALEHHQSQTRPIHNTEFAIAEAREYLATEPSGERAALIKRLRSETWSGFQAMAEQAADMLEADAQQAKRVPMTDREISEIVNRYYRLMGPAEFARAIEAHHGITPADKPTGWDNGLSQDYCAEFGKWLASRPGARQQIKAMFDEPEEEDLYALALKADNWGQP